MPEVKVSIVGGGPSAVYAYFGAIDAGYTKSEIEVLAPGFTQPPGAFWLRDSPIPWPMVSIRSILFGKAEVYSLKQWGYARPTSAEERFADSPTVEEFGFNPYTLLPTLWSVLPVVKCSTLSEREIEDLKCKREAVIQTFPIEGKLPEQFRFPVYCNKADSIDFVCIYNGGTQSAWVRQTLMPGKVFVEYPSELWATDSHLWADKIVDIENDRWGPGGVVRLAPDLHPETVPLTWQERIDGNRFLVGRFATKNRKSLSHESRVEVTQFLKEIVRHGERNGQLA
jgi:hypothetical protein